MAEKESKNIEECLKKVSPGTNLRTVIDDLIRANMGALIVFHTPEVENIIEGGFRLNCKFTPNRLFELCKMDGAVIVSPDLKKIIYSNVLLIPDKRIETTETGTRHKAGERTAKQANTLAIVVSERKNKTILYFWDSKYFLKTTNELLNEVGSNLQLLEKQRELLNELMENFNVLEISNIISVGDVCKIIQRTQMIIKIAEMIKRYFTELGNVGTIMNLRYKELLRGVEKIQDYIIRDYAMNSLKKMKTLLSTFSFESLMDLEVIAKLIIGRSLDENVQARGYRFLSNIKEIPEKMASMIIIKLNSLEGIFSAKEEEFRGIVKNEYIHSIKKEIENVKEQILSGKVIS